MIVGVIGFHQLVIGLSSGLFLIVIGFVPGLFQGLVDGVRNTASQISGGRLIEPHINAGRSRRIGVAGFGAALVTFTILAYLSR